MKIDRFVKAMLVLIAMLLALNCFNNISDTYVEAAPPPSQYKAIAAIQVVSSLNDQAGQTQVTLNQQRAQGWEYVGSAGAILIFKK